MNIGERIIEFGESIRDQDNPELRALLCRQCAEYIIVKCVDIPAKDLEGLVGMCFAAFAERVRATC